MLEKYWNEKYPQQKIIYSGRSIVVTDSVTKKRTIKTGLALDVRNMIFADDVQLKEVIEKNNLKGDTQDETMIRIQRWVVANFKYIYDHDNQGAPEHWQFPFESLESMQGDCEDGGLLLISLALNAEIDPWRIRMVAGAVKVSETAPEGGHGYCVYISEEENNTPYALDWCFYQDSEKDFKFKVPLRENLLYRDVWFSFNHLSSWGSRGKVVQGRLKELKTI